MRLNRSVGYGLMAVAYVALHSKDGLVMAAKVAKAYKIPLEYLLKIMQQLVRANVLSSKRGPGGGFRLARPANEITMLEIVEAVDGPLRQNMEMAALTKNAPFAVKMEEIAEEALAKVKSKCAGVKLSKLIG